MSKRRFDCKNLVSTRRFFVFFVNSVCVPRICWSFYFKKISGNVHRWGGGANLEQLVTWELDRQTKPVPSPFPPTHQWGTHIVEAWSGINALRLRWWGWGGGGVCTTYHVLPPVCLDLSRPVATRMDPKYLHLWKRFGPLTNVFNLWASSILLFVYLTNPRVVLRLMVKVHQIHISVGSYDKFYHCQELICAVT